MTTYTEIRFQDADEKLSIPDGAIVVERGRVRWVCLLEVKTGGAPLRADQVNRYLDLARANGFDAVLTISNQITASPLESPVAIDPRKTKKVALRHLSWWQVMTEARVQHKHRGIADTDQEWILGELIAYLDHGKAGAGGFEDMGNAWVGVREGARQHTLKVSDPGVRDVAARWEQFVQYLALGLCQDLGREVTAVWPRKLEPAVRLDQAVRSLVETGQLAASIRVPDAAAQIDLRADLRTRLFISSAEMNAPREGRPKTRISWLVRQLKDAPDTARIEVRYPNAKEMTSALLKDVREAPEKLLYGPDPKREARSFVVSISKELGTKRGRVPGSFVHASREQAIDFYRHVVQQLRPWTASAPKLPVSPPATLIQSSEPPPFTDVLSREFGEATEPRD
jgi:hypothetical protein